jgi:nitrite reductase/ring-hydroxylating ferredoxin subunit
MNDDEPTEVLQRDSLGYVRAVRVGSLPATGGTALEVAGRWVAVFNVAGEIHVIDNCCPHEAGPLGAGRLEGYVVACPIHGWRFDVRDGCSPTNRENRVSTFDVRIEDGWLWIRLLPTH